MIILKHIGIFFVSFIFRFTLFFGLTLLSAVFVLGTPQTLKNILIEVDAHERFTQSIVDSTEKNQQVNPNSIPVDNPEVKVAIGKALDTKTLTNISDSVIDSTYDWLSGETKDINFSVDLTRNKQVLAENIANFAVNRIASLPACLLPPTETNVFKLECNPTGVDLNQLRLQIITDITNDKTVFADDKFTSANLPKAESGEKITEAYNEAPKYFKWFKLAPFIFLGVSLFCGLIIVYTSRTKRVGFKKVGSTLLSTAVIMAISPLIYVYVLPKIGIKAPSFGGKDESVSAIINDASSQLYSNFNLMLLNVAFQVAVVGVLLLIITRFIKKNSNIYLNIEKKAGLSPSEGKKQNKQGQKDSPKIPIQTSEGPKKKSKKGIELAKKYRKL